jgi:hypothetical protein
MAVQENVEVLVEGGWKLARDLYLGHPEPWMDVYDDAGEHVGTVTDLYMRGEVAGESDDHNLKQFYLDEPLGIDGFGDRVLVAGMRWSERIVTDTFAATSEASGDPRLVLQQLDDKGKPYAGRVIVARN